MGVGPWHIVQFLWWVVVFGKTGSQVQLGPFPPIPNL